MKRSEIVPALATIVLTVASAAAAYAADSYPSHPIRLITPAAPGGTTDFLARLFGAKLTDSLKQQVIVDNRASASGVIAAELTANAHPDGYTLAVLYHQHTVNAALNPHLPYKVVDDFTPITQLTAAGLLLIINPSSPPKNLKEFVEWTKNFKGALNFGSAGIGSGGHLAGELYNLMAGVKAQHIPYKGTGPALIDLIGGQYQYNFAGMAGAMTAMRSGKVRALAVTAPKRLAALPDMPAMAEALPGFEIVGWYGIVGPANMPKVLVTRLHDEFVRILRTKEISDRIAEDGAEPVGNTPEEFRKMLNADVAKWARIVKESGAKMN
ncbi:MAG: tripartite tricarboxylate transporter substrate binding protein [Burkholderiales bacterium]